MTSIRQLAQLAGVSPMTVSRALRGVPSVHPDIRARVEALAVAHHYRPNRLAEAIMTGKTRTIGLILSSLQGDFTSRILQGLVREANADGYQIMIAESFTDPTLIRTAVHTAIEQRVEGVVFYCNNILAIPSISILELWSHNISVVAIDAAPCELPIDLVGNDEMGIAQQALDYLYRLGHRHIAYVGLPYGSRLAAYRTVYQQRGLSTDLLVGSLAAFTGNPDDVQQLYKALIARSGPPTAMIGFEDRVVLHLLRAVRQQGLRVPRDCSLLGCGNLEVSAFADPPLTTIDQHPNELGRAAFRLLLNRMQEGNPSHDRQVKTVLIPSELITRASCAPPRIS